MKEIKINEIYGDLKIIKCNGNVSVFVEKL